MHALQAQLLPASYTRLFGIEEQQAELVSQLLAPDAPWTIAIVGIGGIGKTALADSVVRDLIGRFRYQQVIWLRVHEEESLASTNGARPATAEQWLSQLATLVCPDLPPATPAPERKRRLQQALQAMPTLVVVDNLESEGGTAALVEQLSGLTNPSKFLLTSRLRLPLSATVWSHYLEELPVAAAIQLAREHAATIGLSGLAAADDAHWQPIWEAVGGNPLALKLVVGLASVLPLAEILRELVEANTHAIEQMYRHIYWKAWHSLSDNGRQLLEIMPLAADVGMKTEQMGAASRLSSNQLRPAITELVNRTLLEVRGTPWERRYGIHRLTNAFLRTEIVHLPEKAGRR
jgi:hypothetical protein